MDCIMRDYTRRIDGRVSPYETNQGFESVQRYRVLLRMFTFGLVIRFAR